MATTYPNEQALFDSEASTPRAVATYLVGVRPLIASASEARRAFIREVGMLLQQVRFGNAQTITDATGRLGREGRDIFREAGIALNRLPAPPACLDCHESINGWVDMHVAACEVMVEVGHNGDLKRLREAQSLLAEGRHFARRFNLEYSELATALRRRMDARRRKRTKRSPT